MEYCFSELLNEWIFGLMGRKCFLWPFTLLSLVCLPSIYYNPELSLSRVVGIEG